MIKTLWKLLVLLCCVSSSISPVLAAETIFIAPPKTFFLCPLLKKCEVIVYVISSQKFNRYDSSGKAGPDYFCQTYVDYETTTTNSSTKKIVWTLKSVQRGDTAVYMFDDQSVNPPIDFLDPKSASPGFKPVKLAGPDYDDKDLQQRYVWSIKNDKKPETLNYRIRVNRYEIAKDGTLGQAQPCEPNDPVIDNQS